MTHPLNAPQSARHSGVCVRRAEAVSQPRGKHETSVLLPGGQEQASRPFSTCRGGLKARLGAGESFSGTSSMAALQDGGEWPSREPEHFVTGVSRGCFAPAIVHFTGRGRVNPLSGRHGHRWGAGPLEFNIEQEVRLAGLLWAVRSVGGAKVPLLPLPRGEPPATGRAVPIPVRPPHRPWPGPELCSSRDVPHPTRGVPPTGFHLGTRKDTTHLRSSSLRR